jgi:hypothetical protein
VCRPTSTWSTAQGGSKTGIPTFGWNIQDEWTGPPNLFGEVGALCIGGDCPDVPLPWVASKLHRTRIGVLAYSVAQSANCTDGIKASFAKYPSAKIVFLDKSLAFGVTDFSTDVQKMREANVDLVTTCMDSNGVLGIASSSKAPSSRRRSRPSRRTPSSPR